MHRPALFVFSCIALLACQQAPETPPTVAATSGTTEPPIVTGQDAYNQVCANCHEDGLDGAPRTDHPEDWQGRSSLWQAVLSEHAKQGFLKMPAKGGEATLSNPLVAAAADYMLERTHIDMPPDQ